MLSIFIGNDKIKIAEGIDKKGSLLVKSAGKIDCSGDVVSDGVVNDAVALQVLLNQLISTNSVSSKEATIIVESSEIILRDFKVPKLTTEELTLIIVEKMKKMINKDTEEYLVDFIIIGEYDEDQYAVMAYAIPKDMVKSYYNVLKSIKLIPKYFDVVENARTKLITKEQPGVANGPQPALLYVDISKNLSFYGVCGGKLVFSRKDASPLGPFLLDVSCIKKLDEENADYMDELNFTPGHEHGNEAVDEYCRKFVVNLADAIPKYMQYLMMNVRATELEKIIISGEIAMKKGLDTALEERLNIPVRILESADNVKLAQDTKLIEYADVVGALIRR